MVNSLKVAFNYWSLAIICNPAVTGILTESNTISFIVIVDSY